MYRLIFRFTDQSGVNVVSALEDLTKHALTAFSSEFDCCLQCCNGICFPLSQPYLSYKPSFLHEVTGTNTFLLLVDVEVLPQPQAVEVELYVRPLMNKAQVAVDVEGFR